MLPFPLKELPSDLASSQLLTLSPNVLPLCCPHEILSLPPCFLSLKAFKITIQTMLNNIIKMVQASPGAQRQRSHLPVQETWVRSLGGEDSLEKEVTTHFSVLAWETPWTEEPGGLQSRELKKS